MPNWFNNFKYHKKYHESCIHNGWFNNVGRLRRCFWDTADVRNEFRIHMRQKEEEREDDVAWSLDPTCSYDAHTRTLFTDKAHGLCLF